MADRYHSDTEEKIEHLAYKPDYRSTGDLEPASHTIVPTSRPTIGRAQYSSTLTLAKPNDARLEAKRIAARLSVNITGLGTATHVYLSVRVDVDDADHEIFSEDWTSAGTNLAAVDLHASNKPAVFNLLKDGSAHTFYFLFWADAASQAAIDTVQLWEALGTCSTSGDGVPVLGIAHKGLLSLCGKAGGIGTGVQVIQLCSPDMCYRNFAYGSGTEPAVQATSFVAHNDELRLHGTVGTDLVHLIDIFLHLRSER